MIQDNKRVTKTLGVLKALPPALAKLATNDEDGQWVWATREIVDSVGDIVRVDGVDFAEYHDPDNGVRLKVLAQHLRNLPDGTAPVVGVVDQVVKTTTTYKGKLVKGIALYVRWLRDAQSGALLPLAAHYKQMVDAGGVDSVSVGLLVTDLEPLVETGGFDIIKSSIYEVSFVTIPANAAANVIKELMDTGSLESEAAKVKEVVPCDCDGEDCQVEACCTRQPQPQLQPQPADDDEDEKAAEQPDVQTQLLRGIVSEALATELAPLSDEIRSMTETVKGFAARLDTMESALVVLAQPAASGEDDTQKAIALPDLSELSKRLDDLRRFVSK